MIPQDTLERWQRYLTPGIHDTSPPTDHTARELLRELIDQQLASTLQEELAEAKEELSASENHVDRFQDLAKTLRDPLNDLEGVLSSQDTEIQDAVNRVSKIVQRIQDA